MEWLKQLPNWIKGTIAFFTAVIGFITVFRSNVQLSITVSVTMILIALFACSLYVAFGKKQSDVSGEKSAYRFPDHRREAFAGMVIIPLLSRGLLMVDQTRNAAIIAFTGTSSDPMQILIENYDEKSLTYKLLIKNNTNDIQYLTEIGVVNDVPLGVEQENRCSNKIGAGSPLESVAHYTIYFDVNEPDYNQAMEPPLDIPAHDGVYFDVSLVPYFPSCKDWSSEITLVVKNADGISVQTKHHTIHHELLLPATQ